MTPKITPIVANPSTILNDISPNHRYFSAVDITNGFWSCPIREEDQYRFAFQYCDDILLASQDKAQHLSVLTRLLKILQEAGFLLNKRKVQLFQSEVTF